MPAGAPTMSILPARNPPLPTQLRITPYSGTLASSSTPTLRLCERLDSLHRPSVCGTQRLARILPLSAALEAWAPGRGCWAVANPCQQHCRGLPCAAGRSCWAAVSPYGSSTGGLRQATTARQEASAPGGRLPGSCQSLPAAPQACLRPQRASVKLACMALRRPLRTGWPHQDCGPLNGDSGMFGDDALHDQSSVAQAVSVLKRSVRRRCAVRQTFYYHSMSRRQAIVIRPKNGSLDGIRSHIVRVPVGLDVRDHSVFNSVHVRRAFRDMSHGILIPILRHSMVRRQSVANPSLSRSMNVRRVDSATIRLVTDVCSCSGRGSESSTSAK